MTKENKIRLTPEEIVKFQKFIVEFAEESRYSKEESVDLTSINSRMLYIVLERMHNNIRKGIQKIIC